MSSGVPPPPQTMGLLEDIAENALDDDYYEVRPAHSARSGGSRTVVTAVGLALFALLVTISVLQSRTDRPIDKVERNTLIANIQNRKDSISKGEAQANKLRDQVAKLQSLSNRRDPEFEALRITAGDLAASGPGVVITADNSTHGNSDGRITDKDLQLLVNGLWYAGAEAISINGNRLSTLSSIRQAGGVITVNFTSIGPPYTIRAIGNTESLKDRLSDNPAGKYWEERATKAGLRFDVRGQSGVYVPAAPQQRVSTTHSKADKGES